MEPASCRRAHVQSASLPHMPYSPRPPLARHMTTPGCSSHPRTRLSPRVVKETLNATLTETLAGARMLNHYLIKEPIGRGSFGAVYLAVDSFSNCEYAIKEFSKARLRRRSQSVILRRARSTAPRPPLPHRRSASDIHHDEERGNPLHLIRGELAVMKKLAHANVVDLIEVLDDPNNDSLYMVLGLCKKGVIMDISLASKATPYTDSQCRKWFRDLILGIEYLHAQEIVHRDIKPDNLLLTKDGTLKIVDFGVSEMFSKNDDTLRDTAGSPAFLAPEMCSPHQDGVSGKAADIWSMGVTLYCLKFGYLPFIRSRVLELYEAIRNSEPEYPEDTDRTLVRLFKSLLDKNPSSRIKMPALRNHAWVTNHGTDPIISVEENLADVVTQITEEEVRSAIKSIRNIMTVWRAVHKLKKGLSMAQRDSPCITSPSDSSNSSNLSMPLSPSIDQSVLSSGNQYLLAQQQPQSTFDSDIAVPIQTLTSTDQPHTPIPRKDHQDSPVFYESPMPDQSGENLFERAFWQESDRIVSEKGDGARIYYNKMLNI